MPKYEISPYAEIWNFANFTNSQYTLLRHFLEKLVDSQLLGVRT